MKILIAPDSFKDALSALEVCKAIERGARRSQPTAGVQLFPLADGGEGTVEVLAWHLSGQLVKLKVQDPLLRPVEAQYFSFGKMAFVEMAEASGLQRLGAGERNPLENQQLRDRGAFGACNGKWCGGGLSGHWRQRHQ